MAERKPHRVHTIVLTRDRPSTLRRCVSGIVRQLGQGDALTVLDDSGTECVSANVDVVRERAGYGQSELCHLEWRSTSAALRSRSGTRGSEWLVRTHDRDIAPLRNLSLLLAAAVPSEIVVLVDDDIVGAAPALMYEEISRIRRPGAGVVMGAQLHGVSELDIITRLWQGVEVLAQRSVDASECDPKSVFGASTRVAPELQVSGRYPSGGYLGFALEPGQMTAFPPGYNEDWLWGHLRRDRPDVQVAWASHAALHDPPSVRRPTDADCIFELTGDLSLDCLEMLECPAGTGPIQRLALLAEAEPIANLMPIFRLQALREGIAKANLDEKARSILLEHGLGSLERLSHAAELDVDWRASVVAWSRRAAVAIHSFEAALTEGGVLGHVRSAWTEGQVR